MKTKKKEKIVPSECMRCGRRQTYCIRVKGEAGKSLGCAMCDDLGYRLLTEREAKKKYTKVVKCGDSWRTLLVIGHQSFYVTQDQSKLMANWYAKMLSKALCRMVDKEASDAT